MGYVQKMRSFEYIDLIINHGISWLPYNVSKLQWYWCIDSPDWHDCTFSRAIRTYLQIGKSWFSSTTHLRHKQAKRSTREVNTKPPPLRLVSGAWYNLVHNSGGLWEILQRKKTSSFWASTIWYNQIMGATASLSSPTLCLYKAGDKTW